MCSDTGVCVVNLPFSSASLLVLETSQIKMVHCMCLSLICVQSCVCRLIFCPVLLIHWVRQSRLGLCAFYWSSGSTEREKGKGEREIASDRRVIHTLQRFPQPRCLAERQIVACSHVLGLHCWGILLNVDSITVAWFIDGLTFKHTNTHRDADREMHIIYVH